MKYSNRPSLKTEQKFGGKLLLSAVAAAALVFPIAAQTTTTPAVSTLTAFTEESIIDPTTVFANVPFNLGALAPAVASGAVQIRQRLTYTPFNNTLEIRGFLAPPSTASPTPSLSGLTTAYLFSVTLDRISVSSVPVPNILFTGTVTSTVVTTPLGTLNGSTVAVSMAYTAGKTSTDPATYTAVTTLLSGVGVIYSANGLGTYTITTPGTGGGGGGTTSPVTAVAGPKNATSFIRSFQLDASKSTSTVAGTLTYAWTVVSGSASLSSPNTANPFVVFAGGQGNYVFQLTVTDSAGNKGTDTVTVFYSGR
jgi:hypothetical protein